MTDKIPTIKTLDLEGVKLWMKELKAADLLWHMDDSPSDCFVVQDGGWTEEDILLLAAEQNKAWGICNKLNADIHEFALEALGM